MIAHILPLPQARGCKGSRLISYTHFLGADATFRLRTVDEGGRAGSRKYSPLALTSAITRLAAGRLVEVGVVAYSPSLTSDRIGYNAYDVSWCKVQTISDWNYPPTRSLSFDAIPLVYPEGVMPEAVQGRLLGLVGEVSQAARASTASIAFDRSRLAFEEAIERDGLTGWRESGSYLRGYAGPPRQSAVVSPAGQSFATCRGPVVWVVRGHDDPASRPAARLLDDELMRAEAGPRCSSTTGSTLRSRVHRTEFAPVPMMI